ncbi:MAG: adenosine deaminase [Armatimonadetes bacterium]|nr:adenosine deaminase [Anaerolineae bacterium]
MLNVVNNPTIPAVMQPSLGQRSADLEAAALYQTISALPKIELHRHLEGAVRLATLADIAREFAFEMPDYDPESLRPFVQMMPDELRDATHFLGKFATLRQFYRSPAVIQRIAREAVYDAAADNIKYMELRFTPRALGTVLHAAPGDVIGWVAHAVNQAAAECGIIVRLITSINRHESVEVGEQVLHAAFAYAAQGVVAVDLAGKEEGYPANLFLPLFRDAKASGFGVTIHAGEWEGAQSVWDAIGNMGATRVGHGIRALEDPGILSIMQDFGIVLEVCPTSNVDSGVVEHLEQHPLPFLTERGLITTINTDDPLISNITLTDELYRAAKYMGFGLDDLKQATLRAAEASFLPDDEKLTLVAQFRHWLYPPMAG